jgi:DedD protein
MERRVKERLVGATILAVLIVLIVPELLSGPPTAPVGPKLPVSAPEPVRNVTVDLATAKPPVIEPANPAPVPAPQPPGTPSGAAERTEAGGGATAGAGATTGAAATDAATTDAGAAAGAGAVPGDATPSARLESTAPTPTTPAQATVSKSAAAGHGWTVQLGSFASRSNADKLARQVKGQGFSVFVLSSGSGAAARYRVRIGPLADRGAATQAAAKLKGLGHIGSLVPPA